MSYVRGLNDQSMLMFEDYQRRFNEDPFDEETIKADEELLDELSNAQRIKWKEMVDYRLISLMCQKYRLISLVCHIYKMFGRTILNRLNSHTEQLIINQQHGLKPGKSTT